MDCLVTVASTIAQYMVAPIARQFDYIRYYKDNLQSLKIEVQKLDGIKEIVQHRADEAKRNGKEIENLVQNWLNTVDDTITKARELIESEGHANANCSMGHIPNLWTRYQLSWETKDMTQKISKIQAEGKFDRISYQPASRVTFTPLTRGYEAVDSRTSMLNDIMVALKNPNIFIIGVYGMGGVGKTTLMKELAWQAEKDGSFGAVAMAIITISPDVEKIQDKIADALDLKLNKETKERRARQLKERISKELNILVILDDIWGNLDLTEVGIPFGDDHKGCKLVVTSRDLNVLNCEMRTQKEFRLDVLLEKDSWDLFEKIAGDVVQEFNIKPIAIEVAKCCAGLPLLLDIVAKALRKKDISYWKSTLNELKRFDQEKLHKVHSTLELSYNCLENDELKSLFLFIGSFAQDCIRTEGMFPIWWALGFSRHIDTLIEARNKFYKLINDLRASSLLLESEAKWIEIHDVVKEVAKSIASRDQPTFGVQLYTGIEQWPEMDQLQKSYCIAILSCYIHELPEMFECPQLKLLILVIEGDYLRVPENFFSGMREVKALHLVGMMFTPSPPPSLRHLRNLRSLHLEECVLEDISIVVELKSLEILSLESSDIKELPKEMGQLANLRMLNLTNCSELRFIPANLISRLTCLEELYMGNCFIQWDVKGSRDQNNNASLDELSNLSQLTTLDIMIQDASVLPRDLQVFVQLERYNMFIGDNWKWPIGWSSGDSESSRTLKFTESKSTNILLYRGFNLLLNKVEDMSIAGLQRARDVLYELNIKGFQQLKHLHIQNSVELKYIINSMGSVHPYPAFPNLETLTLQNLINLEEIYHGQIHAQSFTKLKKIEVEGCDKLKSLLWYSLVGDLPQLLEIKISECKLMTEIIAKQKLEADKEMDKMMFPKLHSLTLECLPSLVSFSSMSLTAHPGFKNYDDTQCIPVALMDQKVGMPHLETLKLTNINSWKLWDDKLPSHSCIQNLRTLTIDKCGSIAYVFSSSVAREFVNLQYLEINNCQMLEEIFVVDGKLHNLPSAQNPISNVEVIFPNLETLVISHMDHLKSVWHNQLAPNSFCKLKNLETKFCNKLLNVIPSYMFNKLQNLETMIVTNCPALEVVFEIQGLQADVGRQTRLEMQLKTLTLEHLPLLKHIWSKNAYESLKFQNLCQLNVTECKSLNQVFPFSVAKELPYLQVLLIKECGVENIVAHDEMADTSPIFVFPELSSLSFQCLTQLRSFYHGLHTLDCPVLRYLNVYHCDQLKLFTSTSLNYPENVPVDPQPLLSIEKVVPNINQLILSSKDVTMLCNGQLNDEHIYTVKVLCLRCFHDESDKFPSDFLQRFFNLENLVVVCSSFSEIFLTESFGSGHSETTTKLRSLTLVGLHNLKFICDEKSEMQLILRNLERLTIFSCSGLKHLVPSWMIFLNLEELLVEDCVGLENLITPAVSTSFPKLKILHVRNCEKIEEIVASDDSSDYGEVAFMKLQQLELINLPRLRCFSKGSYSFKFPLLENLFVINCHMMKTFSYGVLNAPRLREVYVDHTQEEWYWNGDLNTTIRKKFSETNSKAD